MLAIQKDKKGDKFLYSIDKRYNVYIRPLGYVHRIAAVTRNANFITSEQII